MGGCPVSQARGFDNVQIQNVSRRDAPALQASHVWCSFSLISIKEMILPGESSELSAFALRVDPRESIHVQPRYRLSRGNDLVCDYGFVRENGLILNYFAVDTGNSN